MNEHSERRDPATPSSPHSSTVEQYVKTIYLRSASDQSAILPMGVVAEAMEVAPSTATAMVKFLAKENLVKYVPRSGVVLTKAGRQLALQILRRHRLVETFLQTVLGYDWSEVHDDAERLEHAVSNTFIDRLDAFLDYPTFDPHGAPIPTTGGNIQHRTLSPLHVCEVGSHIRIAHINSRDRALLQNLKQCGVVPGVRCTVAQNNPTLASVEIQREGIDTPIALGYQSAKSILIQKEHSR